MHRIPVWSASTLALAASLWSAGAVLANGGPFVVKYPEGDPAAKGVVAPLTDQLKPGREERLKVIKEDLDFIFTTDQLHASRQPEGDGKAPKTPPLPPLVLVSAAYTIENPTDKEIEVTFGFPVLRGLYMHPFSMMPQPDAQVRLNKNDYVGSTVISNSAIYGVIREQARRTIEEAIAKDDQLSGLVARTRATGWVRQRTRATLTAASGNDKALKQAITKDARLGAAAVPVSGLRESDHEAARESLMNYSMGSMKWDRNSARLLVEYAGLDWGATELVANPPGMFPYGRMGGDLNQWLYRNLGPLHAIGEQKATQFFATLAAKFDPSVAGTYESTFSSWGGDVRERSIDLTTGALRPREITVSTQPASDTRYVLQGSDPTVYARVDYLDPNAGITDAEKDSCGAVLKALPVVFTFAPMNLIQYQVRFKPNATQVLTVSYKQYAYKDTHDPTSYQFAYVLHPASMWKDFGPINLKVAVPAHTPFKASVACEAGEPEEYELPKDAFMPRPSDASAKGRYTLHRATIQDKTGELFLAVDAATMDKESVKPATGKQAENQPAQSASEPRATAARSSRQQAR